MPCYLVLDSTYRATETILYGFSLFTHNRALYCVDNNALSIGNIYSVPVYHTNYLAPLADIENSRHRNQQVTSFYRYTM